jgi:hypothetical protein
LIPDYKYVAVQPAPFVIQKETPHSAAPLVLFHFLLFIKTIFMLSDLFFRLFKYSD